VPDIIRDIVRILRQKPLGGRTDSLAAYTQALAATHGLERRSLDGRKHIGLWGYSLEYLNSTALMLMIRELIVDQVYRFMPTSDTPTIVDAGANIGLATFFFKTQYPRARITAFEPEPSACAVLERNVQFNSLRDVTVVNAALSRDAGRAGLSGMPGSLVPSLKGSRDLASDSVEVATDLLSRYIDCDVDLLKLDIEGMELDVFEELAESGKLAAIHQFICEYHHHLDAEADELSRLLALLETFGFGYQIETRLDRPIERNTFQDILIYGYRKK
jgi:FkbM family methyltransferase